MNKRVKLADRPLPDYLKGEEIMNMVTHIVGGGLGLAVLLFCIVKSAYTGDIIKIICSCIYGCSMIALYTMSSIYHGMHPGTAKKVLQIIDHCTIYFLIAGTYTPIVVCAVAPLYPALGFGLLIMEWVLAVVAATLTASDLHNYRVFSMICYIFMGWAIIFFLPQAIIALTPAGFWLTFAGGITYTIGAILYGIGTKRRWMHSVFHIFVVLGSLLQFIPILIFVI